MYGFLGGNCLAQTYNIIPIAVFTVDMNRIITSINNRAAEMFGYKPEQLIGEPCTTFCYGSCCEACNLFNDEISKPTSGETIIKTKDGSVRVILKNIDLLNDEEGNLIGGIETFEDITKIKEIEKALRESEERYRTLFERTANPILVTDLKGTYIDCNEAACHFFECSREELLTINAKDTLPLDMDNSLDNHRELLKKEGTVEVEYSINDKIKVLELTITPLAWDHQKVIFGVGKDITERRQAEQKIWHMAYHDSLTGLPNREFFNESLKKAIAQADENNSKLAVLFLDLDRFKTINDTLGHDMGDEILVATAKRLTNSVRKKDMVARLSGDEFIIMLSDISGLQDSLKVSEGIVRAFEVPFVINKDDFYITPSIGITVYPDDGTDIKTLLRNADLAMYRAKENGGNGCKEFRLAMNEKFLANVEMENNLRRALENQEFTLFYQPQVDNFTGEIVSMEALIRWQHPKQGLVPPDKFIPVAEETGLIIPISEWVMETACAQNKLFQEMGYPPIRVSINLSARQFQQVDLVATIKKVLQKTKLKPNYLELEITESTAMQDLDKTIRVLKDLKEVGVHIALDDFGIGHASLSYLKSFPPIDKLKIDHSFIKDISTQSNNAANALVSTIIALAKNLNLKVVAEGVENSHQLQFLTEQKCNEIQGFIFSEPVSADEFRTLLIEQPYLTKFKRYKKKDVRKLYNLTEQIKE